MMMTTETPIVLNSTTTNTNPITTDNNNNNSPLPPNFERTESVHEIVITQHHPQDYITNTTATTANTTANGLTLNNGYPSNQPYQHNDRTIILALDSSEYSEHAFHWALDNFIRPESDHVCLLNVRPYVLSSVLYGIPTTDFYPEYQRIEQRNREHSHELLRNYAKRLMARNIKCKGIALKGDPKEEIVQKVNQMIQDCKIYFQELQKDLLLQSNVNDRNINNCIQEQDVASNTILIVGSRGMGAIKRALVGSVSDYCVHHCHCPVVVPKK